jgi:hypothetical protein
MIRFVQRLEIVNHQKILTDNESGFARLVQGEPTTTQDFIN